MTRASDLAKTAEIFDTSAYTFRNRIINGAMEINQRAGGIVTATTSFQYITDRWGVIEVTDGTFTARQTTNAPVGFKNALYLETGTADTSLTATQYAAFSHQIEGLNIIDFAFGTAAARTITLSFWARSSLTGTFSGSIRNGALDRSYVFEFTINSANTYEYKMITIPGDTTGTWATDNTAGLALTFSLGTGSTYSTTAGSWVAGSYFASTGSVGIIGTASANFYITGVQLELGSSATPFERRPYAMELINCKRYYEEGLVEQNSGTSSNRPFYQFTFQFQVSKRVAPTFTTAGSNRYETVSGFVTPTIDAITANSFRTYPSDTNIWSSANFIWRASAEF